MANRFQVNTLILSGNKVNASSTNLYVNDNLIAGGSSSINSPWQYLTWNNTTNWNAQSGLHEDRRILVMTGNTSLSINNIYNGWAGLLQTIQSGNAPSGYSLTMVNSTKVMNAGSGIIYLTSGSGVYDMIGFQYDGANLFATVGNQFT